MSEKNIYSSMIDQSKVTSAQQVMNETERLKLIDDFHMEKQLDSPFYKKLSEQNHLLESQLSALEKQNKLLLTQLEESKKTEKSAKEEARKSKIFAYISFAVGTIIGISGIIIALITLIKN